MTVDPYLGALCAQWEDVQRSRLAATQRDLIEVAESLRPVEERLARQITAALRQTPIGPWLAQFPGLRGVHTARLVAIIRDPRRFPGQPCSLGHLSPALYEVGSPCPVVLADGADCPRRMLPPRTGSGVASLWHYCGLHAVDGRSPAKRRGQAVDWNPRARSSLLQPGGIAEHIVRQRVPVYSEIWAATKERLIRERGRVEADAPEAECVPALTDEPLRPFQIDAIARKVAAKAFVGDLLTQWKAVSA